MRTRLDNAEVHNRYRQVTTCTGYTIDDDFSGIAINSRQLIVMLIIATALLGITFLAPIGNFWLCIAVSNLLLAFFAVTLGGWSVEKRNFDLEAVINGFLVAAILLFIVCLGQLGFNLLAAKAPFLIESVEKIYALTQTVPVYLVVLVLLFVTSPCEEIFWRGFVQRGLMQSLGLNRGWFWSAVLYALIHMVSLNIALVLAAFICGLCWGYLYKRQRHIAACIISHALWAVVVFIILPLF